MTSPTAPSPVPRRLAGADIPLRALAWVGLGGFLGTAARLTLDLYAHASQPVGLTALWSTWVVNIAGAFLLGVIATWLARSAFAGRKTLGWLLATGFLGAFTTYSAFAAATITAASPGTARPAEALATATAAGPIMQGIAMLAAGLLAALAGAFLAGGRYVWGQRRPQSGR